jgi:PPM family protein phosphatase
MSQPRLEFTYAEAADQGARSYQEDSVDVWRPNGAVKGDARPLLVVLSDGMGGHVSGEVASKTACKRYVGNFSSQQGAIPQLLEHSLVASNDAIGNAIRKDPALDGMGCTIVASYLDHEGLRWASVGDSSLLLFRAGELRRLNEDHSLGALLDKQAAAKVISQEEAKSDPRRRTLRSALTGGPIAVSEIVRDPEKLLHGDWLIVASDGLETLSGNEIISVIRRHEKDTTPKLLVQSLLDEVRKRRLPNQDNTSLVVVKVTDPTLVDTHIIRPAKKGGAKQADVTEPMRQPLGSEERQTIEKQAAANGASKQLRQKVVLAVVLGGVVLAAFLFFTREGDGKAPPDEKKKVEADVGGDSKPSNDKAGKDAVKDGKNGPVQRRPRERPATGQP